MRRLVVVAGGLALVVAAIPAASGRDADGLKACERATELAPLAPVDVELATVTDTEFVVTWLTCSAGRPAPADSTVTYEELGGASEIEFTHRRDTAFHHVRISGLKRGVSYRYRVSSNGIPAPPDRLNPGAFTTLTPPDGRELFRFAILADIHIGESVSGLATSTPDEFPPGYRSEEPYAARMLEAAVDDVNAHRVSFAIAPADNSSHGELEQLAEAKKLLDGLEADYLVARGSHDRPEQFDRAKQECGADGDCFRAVFRPTVKALSKGDPQHLPQAVPHRRWMFIALDSANLSSGIGELDDQQLGWLEEQLEKAEKRRWPSIIFFHHPVAEYSTTAAVPPLIFGVNQQDSQAFLSLIGRYDVRLVINAHTHRNWIAYSPHTGRMPIIEVGPTKEYPGGYSILRVYEGGFVREWFPIDCSFCNEWRETTRGEYFALYPYYTIGSLRDRSFVHLFDSPDVPGIPSLPFGVWPPLVAGRA